MNDPFKGRRGKRGEKKYCWTMSELSAIVGLHPATIRKHIRQGQFNPEDLHSVAWYISVAEVQAAIKALAEPPPIGGV